MRCLRSWLQCVSRLRSFHCHQIRSKKEKPLPFATRFAGISALVAIRQTQVQAVRVPELACIAIGRPEHENNLLTAACLDATELEILQGHAARVLNRAFVPQQLLDGTPDEFGMIAKFGGLFRVT